MPNRVPVTPRALIARINRKLAQRREGRREKLCVARPGSRLEANVGRFYALDLDYNRISDTHIDIEAKARALGCMAEYEELAEAVGA